MYAAISTALLCCTLLGVAPLAHAEIYKWVDEAGRVHYGERPGHADAQQLRIAQAQHTSIGRGGASSAPTDIERRQLQARLLRAYALDREEARATARQEAERSAQLRERCGAAEARITHLENARFLFREADGERQVLSDAERDAYTRALRGSISRHC